MTVDKKAKLRLLDVEFEQPIPDYGDVFTIEEFKKDCDAGLFVNSDGMGYYGFKDMMSSVPCYPSKIRTGEKTVIKFTHVIWFNK